MTYEFRSKYDKTSSFSPGQQSHHCCHYPVKDSKKNGAISAEKSAGEYTYQSPYSGQNDAKSTEDYCCHPTDDFHYQNCYLQEKSAQQQQQKSADFIRQRREEEARKLEDQNEN